MVGVHNLKHDLLKIIGVDDFSTEATFRDPSPSFVLQDVICDFCQRPHDLDLLRNPNMLNHSWECPHCAHRFNKSLVEATVVSMAYQVSYLYQSQDLVCQKCKLVKAENLSDVCPHCSGTFTCRISEADVRKKLRVMDLIATFHTMPWLGQVVKRLLQ